MQTTIDLLDKAIQSGTSERALSMKLGLSPATLAVARHRGALSPTAAGQVADMLGENVAQWMALAALESKPRSRVTDRLRRIVQKIGFEHIRRHIERLRSCRRPADRVQHA